MSTNQGFHIADIVVFGTTVVISISIGIYYAFSGGKQTTTSEFLLGGRLISFLPVAISLMVSFESSIMMLGLPAEGYVYGIQFIIGTFGFLIAQILSAHLVVPLLHPLKITSAFEYLEHRYNSKAVRLMGTIMGSITYCWYMGIVLFGPAIALEAVTGFSRWVSIVTISMVAVIYTSIGGLKAVVWTDVFQAFVMFAGIFSILIKGTIDVGGPKQVWDIARKGGRLNFFVFDPNPRLRHSFYNLFFFSIIRGFGMAFNQSTVQRISSTKSVKEAKRVLLLVAPAFTMSIMLAIYEGIVAYAYYETKQCDPFESKRLTNPNQIVPFFVMDIFENLPGMPGLFLAALFSASLSTLSSGLSSLSAMLWADIVHPLAGDMSDLKGTIIAKVSVLFFGALACCLAFLVSLIGGTLIQIASSVLSAFAGPVTGIFLLGCFCPRANSKGALSGGIIGMAFSCWVSFGMNFSPVVKRTPWLPPASIEQCEAPGITSNVTMNYTMSTVSYVMDTTVGEALVSEPAGIEKLYTLSYLWIGPFGILSTIFVGYVISLITGPNKPGDVDPRYLLPFSNSMLVFLPAPLKNWISSLGPQFIKEEYKSKFPDPANKFSVRETEITVLSDIGDDTVGLLDKQEKGENGFSVPTIIVTDEKDDGSATTTMNEHNILNGTSSVVLHNDNANNDDIHDAPTTENNKNNNNNNGNNNTSNDDCISNIDSDTKVDENQIESHDNQSSIQTAVEGKRTE